MGKIWSDMEHDKNFYRAQVICLRWDGLQYQSVPLRQKLKNITKKAVYFIY